MVAIFSKTPNYSRQSFGTSGLRSRSIHVPHCTSTLEFSKFSVPLPISSLAHYHHLSQVPLSITPYLSPHAFNYKLKYQEMLPIHPRNRSTPSSVNLSHQKHSPPEDLLCLFSGLMATGFHLHLSVTS